MSFEDFGRIVKERREELRLTQQELADKMGVHKSAVSRIENAHVADLEVTTFYSLAKALKWDPIQMHKAYHGIEPVVSDDSLKRNALEATFQDFIEKITTIQTEF